MSQSALIPLPALTKRPPYFSPSTQILAIKLCIFTAGSKQRAKYVLSSTYRLLYCFHKEVTIWGLKSFCISPLGGGVRQRRAELPRRHAGVVRHAADGGGGAHREGDPVHQLALPAAPRRHRQAVWHQRLHDDAPGFSEYRQETQGLLFFYCSNWFYVFFSILFSASFWLFFAIFLFSFILIFWNILQQTVSNMSAEGVLIPAVLSFLQSCLFFWSRPSRPFLLLLTQTLQTFE